MLRLRRMLKAGRLPSIRGVDVDYEVLGKENGMLMVSVSGTAVKLK